MGRQRSQIEELERDILDAEGDIKLLFSELGMYAISSEEPIVTTLATPLLNSLLQEKSTLVELEEQIAHLKRIKQDLSDSNRSIGQLKKEILSHKKQLNTLYARIGVIAWEEAASGVLSSAIIELLPTIEERQEQLEELKREQEALTLKRQNMVAPLRLTSKIGSLFLLQRLKKFNLSQEQFFVEVGQKIGAEHLIENLASSLASSLEKEYRELSQELATRQEEVLLLQKKITDEKGRLDEQGIGGSIQRRIQEIQSQYREQLAQVRRVSESYGRALYKEQELFVTLSANTKMGQCYFQIQQHERFRGQLEKQIEELRIESRIGELVYLIEQDGERINHIQRLIEQYNRQIEEIHATISSNREKIGKLKNDLTASVEQEVL